MKISIKIFFLLSLTVLSGCSKEDDFDYAPDTVGSSRITYFPLLTMKGAAYVAVPLGTAYVEPGVSAMEGTNTIPVTTSGTVNSNVAGVYSLNYSAVNKDGFPATASRNVVVFATDATAAANDLSGNYARSTNASIATWTKIAPGVYTVFNPGGAPGTNVTVIVFNPTGFVIDMPSQKIGDGSTFSSINESYSPGPPATFSWALVNPGYGPAGRTFVKQ